MGSDTDEKKEGGGEDGEGSEGEVDITDRFLNANTFNEAAEGFNDYDPESWKETLSFNLSPFMAGPTLAILTETILLTWFALYGHPDLLPFFSNPIDAHVVMGGALSFLIVFRTDASMNRWWEARCTWQVI